MKKLTLLAGLGAAMLGLASFSAPAAAFPAAGLGNANPSLMQTVAWRHHRVCKVRKVVTRDRWGHRRVKVVRVCR